MGLLVVSIYLIVGLPIGNFASWHVGSAVSIVLICCSMNPFDLG